MKMDYSHIGLARLCAWFGVTRQAYYQHLWSASDYVVEQELIILLPGAYISTPGPVSDEVAF